MSKTAHKPTIYRLLFFASTNAKITAHCEHLSSRPFPTVNLIFMIIAMALAAGHVCQQTAALAVGDTPYTHT